DLPDHYVSRADFPGWKGNDRHRNQLHPLHHLLVGSDDFLPNPLGADILRSGQEGALLDQPAYGWGIVRGARREPLPVGFRQFGGGDGPHAGARQEVIGKLNLDQLRAFLAQHIERRLEGGAHLTLNQFVWLRLRHADAQATDAALEVSGKILWRTAGGGGIARVRSRNSLEVGGDVGDCAPEGSDMVKAVACRQNPRPANQSVSRLQAGEAAGGGRETDGASCVGAEACVSKPGRHGASGSVARSAAGAGQIPWIARLWTVVVVPAAVGEFVEGDFAEDHAPGLLGAGDDMGVGVRSPVL